MYTKMCLIKCRFYFAINTSFVRKYNLHLIFSFVRKYDIHNHFIFIRIILNTSFLWIFAKNIITNFYMGYRERLHSFLTYQTFNKHVTEFSNVNGYQVLWNRNSFFFLYMEVCFNLKKWWCSYPKIYYTISLISSPKI